MRFASLLLSIVAVGLFTACQSDPYNLPDPGPAEAVNEPEDRKYTVTYRGNSKASAERVRDLALLRASTITLQKGGTWFEVITEYARNQEEQKSTFELDPFSEIGTSRGDCGVLGCPSRADPGALGKHDRDPETFSRSFNTHSFEIVVNTGQRPAYKDNTYDALEISDEIRRKYEAE